MTPAEERLLRLLVRRAAELSPDLRRELFRAYAELKRELGAYGIERAIREDRLEQLLVERLSPEKIEQAFAPFRAQLQETLREAIRLAARDLPSRLLVTAGAGAAAGPLNVLTPRTADALRTLDTRVMEGLTEQVRATVRQEVAVGLAAGENPRVVAQRTVDAIGLSPRSAEAVRRFREQLEDGDRAALRRMLARGELQKPDGTTTFRTGHAGGQGLTAAQMRILEQKLGREDLTPTQIDAMVEAYRKRLEAWEAETVTRSATLDAQRQASRLHWEDIIARGEVPREWVWKRRRTARDSRVRPEHAEMEGEERHFDEPYSNGEIVSGEASFNCRCQDFYFIRRGTSRRASDIDSAEPTGSAPGGRHPRRR